MADFIIRKAKQDYVCDKCGHVIKASTEYIDRVILTGKTVVKHERYHDECPIMNPYLKIMSMLIARNFELPVNDTNLVKYIITGINDGTLVTADGQAITLEDFRSKFYYGLTKISELLEED